jgi:hypothetical protein
MRRIVAAFNLDGYHQYYAYPLFLARKSLKELGFDVRIGDMRLLQSLKNADCLILDNTLFWKLGQNYLERASILLEKWRKQVERIIWFDTGDSTGEIEYKIIELVDLYLKAYRLKDKTLYRKKFHNNRIWVDYYWRNASSHQWLPPEDATIEVDITKIETGWNYYLGAFNYWSDIIKRCGFFAPRINMLTMRFTPVNRNRPRSVSMRSSTRYVAGDKEYEMVAWQRIALKMKLRNIGIETDPLPRRLYYQELQQSRIAISPFGWGEICLRDFEIIFGGAMLMKPSVEHLETWPNLFIPNVTYVPFRWDLMDIEEAIEASLQNDHCIKFAGALQARYKDYISEPRLDELCEIMIKKVFGE